MLICGETKLPLARQNTMDTNADPNPPIMQIGSLSVSGFFLRFVMLNPIRTGRIKARIRPAVGTLDNEPRYITITPATAAKQAASVIGLGFSFIHSQEKSEVNSGPMLSMTNVIVDAPNWIPKVKIKPVNVQATPDIHIGAPPEIKVFHGFFFQFLIKNSNKRLSPMNSPRQNAA